MMSSLKLEEHSTSCYLSLSPHETSPSTSSSSRPPHKLLAELVSQGSRFFSTRVFHTSPLDRPQSQFYFVPHPNRDFHPIHPLIALLHPQEMAFLALKGALYIFKTKFDSDPLSALRSSKTHRLEKTRITKWQIKIKTAFTLRHCYVIAIILCQTD